MDPDQTAPFGAVWSVFIVFASMLKVVWKAFNYSADVISRWHFQNKNIGRIRVKLIVMQTNLTLALLILGISTPGNSLLFVWVDDLCPSQQFLRHVGSFSWVVTKQLKPGNKVFCSRTQHNDSGEDWTMNLFIPNPAVYHLATSLPISYFWTSHLIRKHTVSIQHTNPW